MNEQTGFLATVKGLLVEALSRKVRLWLLVISCIVAILAILVMLTLTVSGLFFFGAVLFCALAWALVVRLDKLLRRYDDNLQRH